MGMKIKKEEKMQIEKLPTLKLKYTLVVPFMGIVDVLTMGSFFMNPAAEGKPMMKAFYAICGLVGLLFACYLRDRWSPVCSLGAFMEDYDRWKDDPGKSGDRKEKSGSVLGSEESGCLQKEKVRFDREL